jgi:hypothetical protein
MAHGVFTSLLHERLMRSALLTTTGVVLSAAGVASAVRSPQPAAPIAIVDVTIIDVERGEQRPHQTVLVRGNTIELVGAASSVTVPRGSTVISGGGKFLIPGLWDMHVHLSMAGREALPVFLAAGVTGVRDMGGDPIVIRWRDSVASGALKGPRIKAAGVIVESARWLQMVRNLTRPLNRPGLTQELDRRFAVATAEDAERAVDSLAKLGADLVKIRNFPAASAYFTLVRAATRRGMRVAGHAPPIGLVGTVSDSGFASLEHTMLASANGKLVEGFTQLTPEARRDLLQRLARNGTAWNPTFVSGASRLVPDTAMARFIADTIGNSDPTFRYVPRTLRDEWKTQFSMRAVDPDTSTDWGAIERSSLGVVREVADAGVMILAGSDLSVPPLVPGFALLKELEVFVREAGLTPREALAAATINPATTLGLSDKIGRVAPGFLADLVLLDRDPLSDISAIRDVRAVVANGVAYDRETLNRLALAAAK